MKEWKTYLEHGRQYHTTATGALKKREKFTPRIVYNIISMCLEKYVMGFLMQKGDLPENHTIYDLVTYLNKEHPLDPKIMEALLKMDEFQMICSMKDYTVKELTWEDIEAFMEATDILIRDLCGELNLSCP